jgi:hypothetical protein
MKVGDVFMSAYHMTILKPGPRLRARALGPGLGPRLASCVYSYHITTRDIVLGTHGMKMERYFKV